MDIFKNQCKWYVHKRRCSSHAMTIYVNSNEKCGFRAELKGAGVPEATFPDNLQLGKVSESTVYRWMRECGAKFIERRKGFTEKRFHAEHVEYRKKYTERINKLEQRCAYYAKVNGDICHIDDLRHLPEFEDMETWKGKTLRELHGHAEPEPFQAGKCPNGHTETCKCHLMLHEIGHDEAAYHQNLASKKEWTIDGVGRLMPKNLGKSIMVSMFKSEFLGAGLHVNEEQWNRISHIYEKYSAEHEWFEIPDALSNKQRQIGACLFEYGRSKAKDNCDDQTGYWNNENFKIQTSFVLDCLDELFPKQQILLQIDQSKGHLKFDETALKAKNVNFKDGGKRKGQVLPPLRDTKCDPEDVGEFLKPHMEKTSERPHGMLHDDLIQFTSYPVDNDPTRYDNQGPIFNGKYNIHNCKDDSQKIPEEKWRGMRKGSLQLLYERGWVDPTSEHVKGQWAAGWGTGQNKKKYIPSKEELQACKKNNGPYIAPVSSILI